MKWLVIIVIVVLVVVAVVWMRTVREAPGSRTTRQPHRLDDSVTPPPSMGMRPDAPATTEGSSFGGGGTREVPEEPGSDFAWEPGVSDDEPARPESDPPVPGSRPEA